MGIIEFVFGVPFVGLLGVASIYVITVFLSLFLGRMEGGKVIFRRTPIAYIAFVGVSWFVLLLLGFGVEGFINYVF